MGPITRVDEDLAEGEGSDEGTTEAAGFRDDKFRRNHGPRRLRRTEGKWP